MLNIKNQRAHDLARKIAARTGESLTDTVIHALEERLSQLDRQPRKAERILALGRALGAGLPPNPTAPLYDERGLPR